MYRVSDAGIRGAGRETGWSLGALVCVVAIGASCRVIDSERDFVRTGDNHPLKTGPYLVLDTPNRAFVAFKTREVSQPVVEWWQPTEQWAKANRNRQEQVQADGEPPPGAEVHTIESTPTEDLFVTRLDELPRDSAIAYRVRAGTRTTSTYLFRTSVPRTEKFRFVVYGDTRTRPTVHAAVIDAVAKEDVEFAIHTGDMVHRGGVRAQWDAFFQIERPLLVDTPIFPSIGNHDLGMRKYYERYFMLEKTTSGRRYYFYDYGNLRLIALDGEIEGRRGSQQFRFAARALEEANEKGMLSILFLHWPPYSSGAHGSQERVQAPIRMLAREYGVELVVTGHDHIYERTIPIEGTTYVVSGSAGAPTRNVDPKWFTAHARTEPHYVLVDVEPQSLTIRAVNLAGTVFDTAVLRDNPAKP